MKRHIILLLMVVVMLFSACTAANQESNTANSSQNEAETSQEAENSEESQNTEEAQASEDVEETEVSEAVEETDEAEESGEAELADELIIGVGRNLYYGYSSWHMIHNSLAVWESLIVPDENLNPQPQLAESWSSNEDMTQWTIILKDGILFHDGTPLTAEIAAANLQATHEEYTPIPTLESIEVVDDLTFTINLTASTPALMNILANYPTAQLSPASFGQEDTEIPVPYGTGPYKFEAFVDGEIIQLTRNENYWGEAPLMEKITYRYIPDANTRIIALQTGEIDAIADVGSILPSQGSLLLESEGINLYTQDVVTTHYLFFNNDKEPLNNVVVRQAISMAIDRELIVQEAVYGYGLAPVSNITQLAADWVSEDAAPTYDPEGAKELFESVYGDERLELTFVLSNSLANRWPYAEIAQIIQQELSEIGIDLVIESVEGGVWSDMLANDEYDMSMRPFTLSSGDPDDFMTYWAREDAVFNNNYSISYSDAEVQAMVEQAVTETDLTERKALYDELQLIFKEQVPFTPIYHETSLFAARDNVYDLTLDASFKPSLAAVYKLAE